MRVFLLLGFVPSIALADPQANFASLQAAHERFGMEPFAVKQIDPRDVERFARLDMTQRAVCPS